MDLLDNDLLASGILARLNQDTKVKVLPLVCRRFRDVLRGPGDCWRQVIYTSPGPAPGEFVVSLDHERQCLLLFLSWLLPRAHGLQDLRLEFALHPFGSATRDTVARATVDVLRRAAASLRRLEVQSIEMLMVDRLVPPELQPELTALRELHFLAHEGVDGVDIAQLPALERLNVVVEVDQFYSWEGPTGLPHSLTWLGLTPAPLAPLAPDSEHHGNCIPSCVLRLPSLKFLDLSESTRLHGLHDALPHLTCLTGLAIDHANLADLPATMSLLTNLRLLSLHGTFAAVEPDQAVQLTPLQLLGRLRVLSISECNRLPALPPAVLSLTQLKALHVEKSSLAALPHDLHLPRLQMLSIDWRVMYCSHQVLTQLPQLQQLLLGYMRAADEGEERADGAAAAANSALVINSLRRCLALRTVTVLVNGESPLTLLAADLMLKLPCSCPHLVVRPLDSSSFFLTNCEQLAADD